MKSSAADTSDAAATDDSTDMLYGTVLSQVIGIHLCAPEQGVGTGQVRLERETDPDPNLDPNDIKYGPNRFQSYNHINLLY